MAAVGADGAEAAPLTPASRGDPLSVGMGTEWVGRTMTKSESTTEADRGLLGVGEIDAARKACEAIPAKDKEGAATRGHAPPVRKLAALPRAYS